MRRGSRRLDVPHLGGWVYTHACVSPTAVFRWDKVTDAELGLSQRSTREEGQGG